MNDLDILNKMEDECQAVEKGIKSGGAKDILYIFNELSDDKITIPSAMTFMEAKTLGYDIARFLVTKGAKIIKIKGQRQGDINLDIAPLEIKVSGKKLVGVKPCWKNIAVSNVQVSSNKVMILPDDDE